MGLKMAIYGAAFAAGATALAGDRRFPVDANVTYASVYMKVASVGGDHPDGSPRLRSAFRSKAFPWPF